MKFHIKWIVDPLAPPFTVEDLRLELETAKYLPSLKLKFYSCLEYKPGLREGIYVSKNILLKRKNREKYVEVRIVQRRSPAFMKLFRTKLKEIKNEKNVEQYIQQFHEHERANTEQKQ